MTASGYRATPEDRAAIYDEVRPGEFVLKPKAEREAYERARVEERLEALEAEVRRLREMVKPMTTKATQGRVAGAESASGAEGDKYTADELAALIAEAQKQPGIADVLAAFGGGTCTVPLSSCRTCGFLIGPGLTCLCQVQASQAVGWACPKCGCVWGPSVKGCARCNAEANPSWHASPPRDAE